MKRRLSWCLGASAIIFLGVTLRALAYGDYGYVGGMTGSITIESANPQDTNQKVNAILSQHQAAVSNSSTYKDPRTKKQQISLQATVKASELNDILNELAALGKVTTRNSYDASGMAKGAEPEKELSELDREIRRLKIGLSDYPNVANILQKHRQTLISQIKSKDAGKGTANLTIAIQDENYSAALTGIYQPELKEGPTVQAKPSGNDGFLASKGVHVQMIAGAGILLAGLVLGFLLGSKKIAV